MKTDGPVYQEPECCFCTDLRSQDRTLELSKKAFFNRVCRESANFAAFPSLSPVGPGHSLIIPKFHTTSMAQIKSSHIVELSEFIEYIASVLKERFGPMLVFEHGIGLERSGGCGVTHAHFHLLSAEPAVATRIETALCKDYQPRQLADMNEFFKTADNNTSYLLFGHVGGRILFFGNEEVPSQYLRRTVASAFNSSQWDWREYSGWDDYADTQQVLCRSSQYSA